MDIKTSDGLTIKLSDTISKLSQKGISFDLFNGETEDQINQRYSADMWKDGKKKTLNEITFAECYRDINRLKYHHGIFYSRQGKMTESDILIDMRESLKDLKLTTDVERNANKLLGAVKVYSLVSDAEIKMDENIIPFANGAFYVREKEFIKDEDVSVPYKLNIPLFNNIQSTPNFNKWLHDLFYEEDIPVIQEFLGYCLIPSTKAQKSLFLVGEAGVGKSGIGVILESILGDAFLGVQNTQEFLADKFKLPELENKLVLYDDDLDNSALTGTGLYKKLITNSVPISADRKYEQPFRFIPKIKIVSCCNEMLTSLFDKSDGFYRRLLPVIVKPKSKSWVKDAEFHDKLRSEAQGIVQYALIGLLRLIENGWEFSLSQNTVKYMELKKSDENPLPVFMTDVFDFGDDYKATSADILKVYRLWCNKNAYEPNSPRTLQRWINDNTKNYKIFPNNHIPTEQGDKQVRGYTGLRIKGEWKVPFTVNLK